MKKQSFGSILFIALVLIVMYLPIIVVVVYSFNANSSRIPIEFTGWSFKWYKELFSGRGGFGDALFLSLRVAFWSVLISVVIGTLGAIGMAQRTLVQKQKPSKIDTAMEALSSLPIMIPEIILGLAFMILFNAIGLRSNDMRLVLAHSSFCIPYVFMTVKSRLVGMDTALFDAARDLGASPARVVKDITLPLCRPAIVSGAFLALAMSLDDFVISFFVYGAGEGTLPIKIYSSVKVGVSPQVNALCTLIIATIFIAVALSRYVSSVRAARERKRSFKAA
ncbi:MAG: ABC transporter permease [Clostridiales bacterium]|nr:ABC transporter permease [Clostridiales bacterium]